MTAEAIHRMKGNSQTILLTVRLFTLVMLVALMTMHLRSVRVFRWERSVSGGVVVTYCIAVLGLAICAGIQNCGGLSLQVYLCGLGFGLLALNAVVIWQRWRHAGELTRVVAELLQSLGVPLQRHLIIKMSLSVAAAVGLLTDLILTTLLRK